MWKYGFLPLSPILSYGFSQSLSVLTGAVSMLALVVSTLNTSLTLSMLTLLWVCSTQLRVHSPWPWATHYIYDFCFGILRFTFTSKQKEKTSPRYILQFMRVKVFYWLIVFLSFSVLGVHIVKISKVNAFLNINFQTQIIIKYM